MSAMRRFLSVILVLSLLMAGGMAHASREITIRVNGVPIAPDVAPFIENNRTMVPIRFVAEALRAHVGWDGEARMVSVSYQGKLIILFIDSAEAFVDGVSVRLDAPAMIDNSRTFVPLRFVAEALDQNVGWDSQTWTVDIVSKGIGGPDLPEEFVENDTPKDDEIFDREADPITRAKFATKALQDMGYDVEFSILEGVGFVLDSAIPLDVKHIIREEMIWTRETVNNLFGVPSFPIVLFVTSADHKDATGAFTGFPFPGLVINGGIFSNSASWKKYHGVGVPDMEDWELLREHDGNGRNGFRYWLAHEYFHVLQQSYYMEGLAVPWWMEGTATYVSWIALEKDYPRYHKEYWFEVMRSAFNPTYSELTVRTGHSPYDFGFLVLNEILIGKDVRELDRFLREFSVYRSANIAEHRELGELEFWKKFFAIFFGITVEEAELTLSDRRSELIAQMEREYGPWPWYLGN
ncbi:MAG: stalk domain-containing protein [bacterium]|nr:stalk domain-containing protein [bacterium]